jgi:hypothetical protein
MKEGPPPGAKAFKYGMRVMTVLLFILTVRIVMILFNIGPPIAVQVR